MDNRIKGAVAAAVGGLFTAATRLGASAQDVASAGNGGVATASANGGAVAIGDVNSGGNAGNAVGVGDDWGGDLAVDGGDSSSATNISISANGGTAIADASGGSNNIAFVS
jgi:hypothetical protein